MMRYRPFCITLPQFQVQTRRGTPSNNEMSRRACSYSPMARLFARIARRQKDMDVPAGLVALEIAFEGRTVDTDELYSYRLGVGHNCRRFGFDLPKK